MTAQAFNATGFASQYAPDAIPLHFADLADLADLIRGGRAADKPSLPWIKLARFSGIPNPKSKSEHPAARYDAGAEALTGVEGDYDAKPLADGSLLAIEEAARLIAAAGIEAVLFPTPSSTPRKPHWRVLCPTSREYQTDLHATRTRFLARVNGVLGGVLAGESFTLSQSYYFGSIEGRQPIEPIVIPGMRIDLLADLDKGAVYKNGRSSPDAVGIGQSRRPLVTAPEGLVESTDDRALIAAIREQIAAAVERDGIGETPTGNRAFALVTWLLKLRVGNKIIDADALQAILADEWRDVADDLVENALATIGDERGSVEIDRLPETDGRADTFDALVTAESEHRMKQRAERTMALILDTPLPIEMKPEDVARVESFRAKLRRPAGRQAMLGGVEALIADLGGVAPRTNRFQRRDPEEDASRRPLTYWDEDKTLPRISGGCVGMAIGEPGSHKTGLFIKFGLDAIERRGGRVLYIAAEGADGIKGARLPKAREARGMSWATLKAGWATEAETFRLLDPNDHQLLFDEYRDFRPNLIFVDVLTMVAEGDINTPMVGTAIMKAAHALAHKFDATVLIAHHPGKDPSKGAAGSFAFKALADFMWKVWEHDDTVWIKVQKMKDGPDDHAHCYVADYSFGAPVIRERRVSEVMADRAAAEDPVAAAIKAILEDGATFDMGGMIEELISRGGVLPPGIKHPPKLLISLVAEGQLAGYVEVRGSGSGTRYVFKRLAP